MHLSGFATRMVFSEEVLGLCCLDIIGIGKCFSDPNHDGSMFLSGRSTERMQIQLVVLYFESWLLFDSCVRPIV